MASQNQSGARYERVKEAESDDAFEVILDAQIGDQSGNRTRTSAREML